MTDQSASGAEDQPSNFGAVLAWMGSLFPVCGMGVYEPPESSPPAQGYAPIRQTMDDDSGGARSSSPSSGSNPIAPRSSEQNQAYFEQRTKEAKTEAAKMLGAKAPLGAVLGFLAAQRKEIAATNRDPNAAQFGVERSPWSDLRAQFKSEGDFNLALDAARSSPDGEHGAIVKYNSKTPMGGEKYTADGVLCRDLATAIQDGADRDPRETGFEKYAIYGVNATTPQAAFHPHKPIRGYRCVGMIGDQPVPLTASVFPEKVDTLPGDPVGIWIHTDPAQIPKILEHIAALQQRMLETEPPGDESDRSEYENRTVALLARGAWWLCHAMPFTRGSAAVTEMYIDSVLAQRGVNLGARQPGIDLAAFRMSEAQFVEAFPTFFTSTPKST